MTERARAADEFGTIASRTRELAAERTAAIAGVPPRKDGTSTSHCDHCLAAADQPCIESCAAIAAQLGITYD